ncbi:MAG TPA: hypothetical protein VM779_07280 [Thermoanaerobaculia bacterium]|nr:hypothetical protein [Thermoanaerobaculia bacterium]
MGIGIWLVAGCGALLLARLARTARAPWWVDALLAVSAAIAAGLAATALDFGGWREPDWRAGSFAFLAALGALGLFRLIRLLRARRRGVQP